MVFGDKRVIGKMGDEGTGLWLMPFFSGQKLHGIILAFVFICIDS